MRRDVGEALAGYRRAVDAIDEELLRLLDVRAYWAARIASFKAEHPADFAVVRGRPKRDLERERAVLRGAERPLPSAGGAPASVPAPARRRFLSAVLRACRAAVAAALPVAAVPERRRGGRMKAR